MNLQLQVSKMEEQLSQQEKAIAQENQMKNQVNKGHKLVVNSDRNFHCKRDI